MQNFHEYLQAAYAGAAVAAGSTTDNNSTRFDMSGYEGIVFFTTITDSTDTGVISLTVQQNSADSDTGMTAITGAVATATSAADDDLNATVLLVDVYRPRERYVQGTRATATANGAFGEIYAVRYLGRKFPEAEHSTIQAGTFLVGV